jgi:hypothetical protein
MKLQVHSERRADVSNNKNSFDKMENEIRASELCR